MLEKYGVKGKIANKLQGSINKAPWTAACKKKYKYHADGYDMVLTKLISVWEERIGDQNYHPFKNVEIGPDRWEVHQLSNSGITVASLSTGSPAFGPQMYAIWILFLWLTLFL